MPDGAAINATQIFRAGCKLVLGSGASAGQEGRFVTAVVGSVETGGGGGVGGVGGVGEGGAGGGGYVVLEMPVKLDHAEGTRVANGRPGRAEAAAYRKRQARGKTLGSSCLAQVFRHSPPLASNSFLFQCTFCQALARLLQEAQHMSLIALPELRLWRRLFPW